MTIFTYSYYENHKIELCIIFIGLVILFQPIIKIPLGRGLWNVVDILVASFLLYLAFIEKKK
jgi:hypothetical protein